MSAGSKEENVDSIVISEGIYYFHSKIKCTQLIKNY